MFVYIILSRKLALDFESIVDGMDAGNEQEEEEPKPSGMPLK